MIENSSTCKNVDPWKSRGAGNRCLDLWEAVQGCVQSLQFTGFAGHLPWVNLWVWVGYYFAVNSILRFGWKRQLRHHPKPSKDGLFYQI